MLLKTNKHLPFTFLLLVWMLLGYTSCRRNLETSNQGRHIVQTSSQTQPTVTTSSQVSPTPKKPDRPGKIPIEEALPDALIDRVKNSKLQQVLRELRKNPATIDKAVPSSCRKEARTVLQLAAIYDELEVLQALLQAGADPNITIDITIDKLEKSTALLETTRYHKNENAIQALLEAGADASKQNFWGFTALHLVAGWKDVDKSTHKTVIRLLLAKEADTIMNLKDYAGRTPLETAKYHHQDQEIIVLLEQYKQRPSADK